MYRQWIYGYAKCIFNFTKAIIRLFDCIARTNKKKITIHKATTANWSLTREKIDTRKKNKHDDDKEHREEVLVFVCRHSMFWPMAVSAINYLAHFLCNTDDVWMSDCVYVLKLNAALVFPLSIALIQCVARVVSNSLEYEANRFFYFSKVELVVVCVCSSVCAS